RPIEPSPAPPVATTPCAEMAKLPANNVPCEEMTYEAARSVLSPCVREDWRASSVFRSDLNGSPSSSPGGSSGHSSASSSSARSSELFSSNLGRVGGSGLDGTCNDMDAG